jgi:hypothetical protein
MGSALMSPSAFYVYVDVLRDVLHDLVFIDRQPDMPRRVHQHLDIDLAPRNPAEAMA